MTIEIVLQKCPFCGKDAILESNRDTGINWYWVKCVECYAQTFQDESIMKAIDFWNMRTAT